VNGARRRAPTLRHGSLDPEFIGTFDAKHGARWGG
jgi:hypothetical protein